MDRKARALLFFGFAFIDFFLFSGTGMHALGLLFLLFAVLGALRYRSTQSKPGWIAFVGLVLFMFAGRIYYTTRRLRLMDNADR